MHNPIKLVKTRQHPTGGRMGTAYGTKTALTKAFGRPNVKPSDDGRVTCGWRLMTPRGPIEIRDYWWNAKGEWSIAAGSWKAALWARRALRSHGFNVPYGKVF